MRLRLVLLAALFGCATPMSYAPLREDGALREGRRAWEAAPKVAPREPVNVVLLVADDLGRFDTSMYGDGRARTPSIDRIAQGGVAFGAGYVTAPICSPSRAGLLTGRYQQRFGHEGQPHERYAQNGVEYWAFKSFVARGDWKLFRWAQPAAGDLPRQGLPTSELTLADLLKRAGYATGAFGKWHLGWSEDFQPQHRGFDEHYGFYEAYTLYYADVHRPDVVNLHHDDFSDDFLWSKGRSGSAAIRRNGQVIDEPGSLTDRIADEAISFIDRNKDRPFFAYVPFLAPHTPHQTTQAELAAFASEPDPNRRVFLALIASLDRNIGRILDALDARGLSDKTLVIFLADNGAALYTRTGTNLPLAGGKMSLFEGGVRVPFAMRWPGRVPAGARFDEPVSALDVVATVAAAAGLELPRDRPYDGVDLLPFVRGEKTGAPHEALYWRAEYARAVRKGRHKLIQDRLFHTTALYDLLADPGERRDLSTERPDLVRALEADLDGFEKQCRAPLWPHVMEYRHVTEDGREFYYPL